MPADAEPQVRSSGLVGDGDALRTEIERLIKEWRDEAAQCDIGAKNAIATDPAFAARWEGKGYGLEICARGLERAVRRAQGARHAERKIQRLNPRHVLSLLTDYRRGFSSLRCLARRVWRP